MSTLWFGLLYFCICCHGEDLWEPQFAALSGIFAPQKRTQKAYTGQDNFEDGDQWSGRSLFLAGGRSSGVAKAAPFQVAATPTAGPNQSHDLAMPTVQAVGQSHCQLLPQLWQWGLHLLGRQFASGSVAWSAEGRGNMGLPGLAWGQPGLEAPPVAEKEAAVTSTQRQRDQGQAEIWEGSQRTCWQRPAQGGGTDADGSFYRATASSAQFGCQRATKGRCNYGAAAYGGEAAAGSTDAVTASTPGANPTGNAASFGQAPGRQHSIVGAEHAPGRGCTHQCEKGARQDPLESDLVLGSMACLCRWGGCHADQADERAGNSSGAACGKRGRMGRGFPASTSRLKAACCCGCRGSSRRGRRGRHGQWRGHGGCGTQRCRRDSRGAGQTRTTSASSSSTATSDQRAGQGTGRIEQTRRLEDAQAQQSRHTRGAEGATRRRQSKGQGQRWLVLAPWWGPWLSLWDATGLYSSAFSVEQRPYHSIVEDATFTSDWWAAFLGLNCQFEVAIQDLDMSHTFAADPRLEQGETTPAFMWEPPSQDDDGLLSVSCDAWVLAGDNRSSFSESLVHRFRREDSAVPCVQGCLHKVRHPVPLRVCIHTTDCALFNRWARELARVAASLPRLVHPVDGTTSSNQAARLLTRLAGSKAGSCRALAGPCVPFPCLDFAHLDTLLQPVHLRGCTAPSSCRVDFANLDALSQPVHHECSTAQSILSVDFTHLDARSQPVCSVDGTAQSLHALDFVHLDARSQPVHLEPAGLSFWIFCT